MAGSGTAHLRDNEDTLLRVEDLVVNFSGAGGRTVHAVSGISFDLKEGETLGLVGESGCGKSTTGKAVLQVPRPTSGSIKLDGRELTELGAEVVEFQMPMSYRELVNQWGITCGVECARAIFLNDRETPAAHIQSREAEFVALGDYRGQ